MGQRPDDQGKFRAAARLPLSVHERGLITTINAETAETGS
jgi:hypothetical protein